MPTPDQIEQAEQMLSDPELPEDVKATLRQVIGGANAPPEQGRAAEGKAPLLEFSDDEVEPYNNDDGGKVTTLDPIKIEGRIKPRVRAPKELPKREPSLLEDAAFGVLNGATFGHADDIYGLLTPGDTEYNRQLYRGEDDIARKAHSKAHFVGSMVGAAPGAYLAAPLGPTLGAAVGGALQAHGDSDGASKNAEELLRTMVIGGSAGAVVGELGQAVPGVARWAGQKLGGAASRLGNLSEDYLMRATGMSAEEVRALGDKLKDYVSNVRTQGFDEGLPSTRTIGERAEQAAGTHRKKAEAIMESLGDDAVLPATDVSDRIRSIKSKYAKGEQKSQPFRNELDDVADSWAHTMPKKPMRIRAPEGPDPLNQPQPSAAARRSARPPPLPIDPEKVSYRDPAPAAEVPEWYEADFENVTPEPADVDQGLRLGPPRSSLPAGPPPPEQIGWRSSAESLDDHLPEDALAGYDDNLTPVTHSVPESPVPTSIAPRRPEVQGDARFTDDGAIADVWGFDEGMPEVPGQSHVMGTSLARTKPPMPEADTGRVRYGIPFDEAQKARSLWGEDTNFAADSPAQAVRQDVYGAITSGMRAGADRIVPGSGRALRDTNWNEHVAIAVSKAARKRALQQTNNVRGPLVAGTAGAAAGGAVGMLTGGAQGAVRDATLGATMAGAAARGVVGREHIIASRAAQAAAAPARGMANGISRAADAADKLNLAPTLAVAAGTKSGGQYGKALASAQREQRAQAQDEAQGWKQPETIHRMLQTDPNIFGPFLQSFVDADRKNEPATWSALLERMDHDPVFVRSGARERILQGTKGSR